MFRKSLVPLMITLKSKHDELSGLPRNYFKKLTERFRGEGNTLKVIAREDGQEILPYGIDFVATILQKKMAKFFKIFHRNTSFRSDYTTGRQEGQENAKAVSGN